MSLITLHLGDITSGAQAEVIVNAANASVERARFWLFDRCAYDAFQTALEGR